MTKGVYIILCGLFASLYRMVICLLADDRYYSPLIPSRDICYFSARCGTLSGGGGR